jgi:hypothetical protein
MLASLEATYQDYKAALTKLRELDSHPNFGITIHLDDEAGGRMETVVPSADLIAMFLELTLAHRDQLANAYRAEANALEGELV